MYLTLAFTKRITVQAIGDSIVVLKNNKHLELKDCLYVPKSKKNLISISYLNKLDYLVSIKMFLFKKMIHLFA